MRAALEKERAAGVPIAAANFDRTDSGLVKEAQEWVAVISSVVKDGKPVGMVSARDVLGPELQEFESELQRRTRIGEILG